MLNQFLEYPVQPLWSVVWLLALPVHNLPCVYYNNYSTISPAFTRKKKYMIEFLVKGMKYVALIDIWEITWIVDAHFSMQDTSNVIIINRILILVLQYLIVLLYHPAFHCPCLHEPFGMYVPYTYACHSVQVMKLNFSIQEVNFSDCLLLSLYGCMSIFLPWQECPIKGHVFPNWVCDERSASWSLIDVIIDITHDVTCLYP